MYTLLVRARDGDSLSKSLIVEELRPRIEKMSAYFGRLYRVDVDDLCQEAWIAVLEMLPRLDLNVGVPEQHLLKRARWKVLDAVRSHRRRQHLALDEADTTIAADSTIDSGPDIEALFTRLTVVQRRILKALMEGYTWREVGARLGCTSANVAYHVRRIRLAYQELEAER
ncbi:MAG TPA: sigma-70 family RNA polymerase sigma factor [Chthonomonadales bacterium]|nr:sigma-70 family RNA polymerase sigma factor [Chthonomonadales bacterium]